MIPACAGMTGERIFLAKLRILFELSDKYRNFAKKNV